MIFSAMTNVTVIIVLIILKNFAWAIKPKPHIVHENDYFF